MKKIFINGAYGNSQILIGETIFNLPEYLPEKKVIVITDANVNNLYGNRFNQFPVIEIETGETIKTFDTVESIISSMLELGADRHSFLVGIGGGVVCDITGFAASVFMRGIDFGFVSTSLLSQVDASIGGKNGINFHSYKNLVGTFNQPQFVICDTTMLKTLPEKEIRCGWGEIVKHTLIADRQMFYDIVEHQDIFRFDADFYRDIVFRNVRIKASIVNRDEKDSGERKKLNFGHTLGHSIEKLTGLSHGEAVVSGMYFAAWWSKEQQLLSVHDFREIKDLLNGFNTKTPEISPEKLFDAVKKDKKRNLNNIDFVFLRKIGCAEVKTVSIQNLTEAIKKYWESE